ncbi:hypothetical protein AB0I77_49890 [Streptomyces sp. NPDC050619]|uniref:hypothetical protein n=1 Tax=Streptomyces sp. NPDC050619 TaxID=3157214 RepID=UPI0034282ABA
MNPSPARTLAASALALCALLTTAACSALTTPPTAPKPDLTATTSRPATTPAPAGAAALTQAQAQAALIRVTDLGEPWTPAQSAATWHDGLLKARTNLPDCRRLLDSLYAEELFGTDPRARAVIGLDDTWNEAQLRYQVVTQPRAEVDRTLAWLKTLPRKCEEFTATNVRGTEQGVEVTEAPLPEVGDARQALRVTVYGETPDGEPVVLTVDVAAVRVGDDAIVLTHGGFGDVAHDITEGAVHLGAERLTTVRKQGRAEI